MVVVCWTTLDRDEIIVDVQPEKDWYISVLTVWSKLVQSSNINTLDAKTKLALEQIHKPTQLQLATLVELNYSMNVCGNLNKYVKV